MKSYSKPYESEDIRTYNKICGAEILFPTMRPID